MSPDTDVLIVGARSTGLTLACALARSGTRVRIIEMLTEYPTSSRGKSFSVRSQEAFEDLGVLEHLRAKGRDDMPWIHYQTGRAGMDLWTRKVLPPRPGVPYPYPLQISTPLVEAALRDRLSGYGVSVELGQQLTGLAQDDSSVVASVTDSATGATRTITAQYLVGCDGGRSTVRKEVGVEFRVRPDPESAMFVGDVELTGLDRSHARIWYSADGAFLGLCPLPGTNSWQFQFKFTDRNHAPGAPSLDLYQKIVDRYCPQPGVHLTNATWLSLWRENNGMVLQHRVGRVFIAGDAAHIHSPAGGQGANTGIQDAYNLGWKLNLVLSGLAGEQLLNTYHEERNPVAAAVLASISRFNKIFWPAGNRRSAFIRRNIYFPWTNIPGVVDRMLRMADQTKINYRASSLSLNYPNTPRRGLAAGDRAPDDRLPDQLGSQRRLFEVFRGDHFTLLGFGLDAALMAGEAAAAHPDIMTACAVLRPDTAPVGEIGATRLYDGRDRTRRLYGITGDGLVIVRPDGYIGLRSMPADKAVLDRYLHRQLGLTIHDVHPQLAPDLA